MEAKRAAQQRALDNFETPEERNRTGQHATPWKLALQLVRHAAEMSRDIPRISFLAPAAGTGAFYSALLHTMEKERIERAQGYETNGNIAETAAQLWNPQGLTVLNQDFTAAAAPPHREQRFNLIVCNPPYVRHHHISTGQKERLHRKLSQQGNMELPASAGLYAYFMGLAHPWMSGNALAIWLVPGEFMDVNYGKGIRDYLTTKVTLLRVHRFDPRESHFQDALVSPAAIYFRNNLPPQDHLVRISMGGTLDRPGVDTHVAAATLREDRKWSRHTENEPASRTDGPTLADLFEITRGIATGGNAFFVLTEQETTSRKLPAWALAPLLPPPRKLPLAVVQAHPDGTPALGENIERLFLLDCRLNEPDMARKSPELAQYLEEGRNRGAADTYICKHRSPWYTQERRPPPPFLCTYMGRKLKNRPSPFRFILNYSNATALNTYLLMYPKEPLATGMLEDPETAPATLRALQDLDPDHMIREGRTYGGELRKLEPRELGRVEAGETLSKLYGGNSNQPAPALHRN